MPGHNTPEDLDPLREFVIQKSPTAKYKLSRKMNHTTREELIDIRLFIFKEGEWIASNSGICFKAEFLPQIIKGLNALT